MPLCSALCAPSSRGALPLAGQGHGEAPAGQGRLGRADAAGQASASAATAAGDQGNGERADSSVTLGSERDSSLVAARGDSASPTREPERRRQLPRVRRNLLHADGATFSLSRERRSALLLKSDGEGASRLLPGLAELALGLQSGFERGAAEALGNDELVASPGSASSFRSELAPPSDPSSSPGAEALPSEAATTQLRCFSKAFGAGGDCAVVAAPGVSSLINEFSCESAASLKSLAGSAVTGERFHCNCLQLKASSGSGAAALPLGRGPSKLLTTSSGSLRSLPLDRGPRLPSAALRVAPRLLFQVSEVFLSARAEPASGSALPAPEGLCTSLLELVTGGTMTSLALCLLRQGELKALGGGAPRPGGALLPPPASASLLRGGAAGLAQGIDSVVSPA